MEPRVASAQVLTRDKRRQRISSIVSPASAFATGRLRCGYEDSSTTYGGVAVRIKVSWIGSIGLLCVSCLWVIACGTVLPDPATPKDALCFKSPDAKDMECGCPTIPETLGTCSDGRIVRALLVCGGPERTIFFGIGNSRPEQPALGTNRFRIQFLNGSRFQGSLITPDPGCWIKDGTDIDFTFGAVYTGDQGEETAADGSTRVCIRQSKVDYSSFNFDLVGNAVHEGNMKARLHAAIDSTILTKLYPSSVGRCQNWREMP